jgi:alpha-glucosidase
VALGEISSEDSLATTAQYTQAGRLHMGYSFELLTDDFSAAHIRGTVEQLEAQMREGWPCWAISNHDVERVLSRWGGERPAPALANLFTALVCSLRGSVCVYQGEELGLTEAEVPYEALKDPYGIAFWPQFKGRDGCRTPMPWSGGEHAGFSASVPWLPVPPEHRTLAVAQQEADPVSVLQGFRRILHWRRGQSALRWGDIRFLDTPEPVLAFLRCHAGETLLVAFNLGDNAAQADLPLDGQWRPVEGHGLAQGVFDGGLLRLPGHGVLFARQA